MHWKTYFPFIVPKRTGSVLVIGQSQLKKVFVPILISDFISLFLNSDFIEGKQIQTYLALCVKEILSLDNESWV